MSKQRLTSKIMISSTGKLIITIHILANVSRRKSNQAMKFGQLIENNLRIIFKSHIQNVVEKLVPRPSLKHRNWAYFWINRLAIYIKVTRMTTCLHFIQNFFKNKRGRELVSLPHFLQDLWRKIVLTLYSDQILTNQISLSDYWLL